MTQKRFLAIALSFVFTFIGVTTAHAREVKLEHDGLTLNAELELAPGKSLADGVILMTHGTLAHARMEIMSGLQATFKEYGFNTLAINLSLGLDDRHRMYDCDTTHRHQHTDALDEIGVWLTWAKGQGAGDIVLLGHSRGGNQTAWFAAERGDPGVRAVVLVAPQMWSPEYARNSYKKRYGTDLDPILDRAKNLVAQGKGATVLKGVDFIYCEDTSVSAQSFVSYYETDPRKNTPHLLPKIHQPVLVFAGTADTVVDSDALREQLAPMTDSDRVSLEVIQGAGHMFRDLYWYDIVETVDAFLDEHE